MQTSGILLIDKSSGITSHDVVNLLRKKLNIKKIGHAGTLDPEATGLLILLINRATKLAAKFLNLDKTYEVKMNLGISTNTADATGKVIAKRIVPEFSLGYLEEILMGFKGEILQVPPMFSAKKIAGKKLYLLARKGIEIERKPQKVNILSLKIIKFDLPGIYFLVKCSSGTYIRALCQDMGEKLGCGAHMSALRRLACGDFKVEEALPIVKLDLIAKEELEKHIRQI